VTLSDCPSLLGASWDSDNIIVFGTFASGLMRVSASGGTPQAIIKPESGIVALPQMLPDGEWILYTDAASVNRSRIMVQSPRLGEPKELFPGISARYLPTGHIVYAVGGNLLTASFDPEKLESVGGQVPVIEGVFQDIVPRYAVSESGTLAYVPWTTGAISPDRTFVWVDMKGKEEELAAPPNAYAYPRISPNGTQIALTIGETAKSNIWIWDLVHKTMTRLTLEETMDFSPLWSPDGKRIAFSRIAKGENTVYWKATDGTGKDEILVSPTGELLFPSSWSQDGENVLFEEVIGASASIVQSALAADLTSSPKISEIKA
jgi:Tol biopolymer transport system component